MRQEKFSHVGKLQIDVSTPSGDIEILEAAPGEVSVELRGGRVEDYTVELVGTELIVRPLSRRSGQRRYPSTDIRVRVADGAAARVTTSSGDVAVSVSLRRLVMATASGDLRVTDRIIGDFEARTASGDIKLGDVDGNLTVTTASGHCHAGDVGQDVRFNSASGDVRLGSVGGTLELKTVSGSTSVAAVRGRTARVKTLSGNVRLGVPPGRTVELDMQTLSGDVVNRLEKVGGGAAGSPKPLSIDVKTVSGNLKLENADSP